MAEAKFILEQIKKGTALAEAKMVRLSHLQEHYRITNAELGLTDNNDLPNRVTISLALAEKRSQPKALAKVPVIKETKEQEPTQIRVC